MTTPTQRNIIGEGFGELAAPSLTTPNQQTSPAAQFDPGPVLANATPAQLKRAFADNLFALFRAMHHLPGSELDEQPAISRHLAFPVNPMFKGAWQTRTTTGQVDDLIKETLDWFRTRNAPFCFWWVEPDATPANLGERLQAHGFAPWEVDAPGMAAELGQLQYDLMTKVPAGFHMSRVKDQRGLLAFKEVFIASYEIPEFAAQAWVDATLAFGVEQAPWRIYVGWLNDEPVACNMLFLGGGVAGVFAVGTTPSARGQGIGAAITLIAYEEAQELGYRYGVLFATEQGAPVYRRIGFEDVGAGISRYLWRAA
jgi:GNAT superfamily N-acetyltransferase